MINTDDDGDSSDENGVYSETNAEEPIQHDSRNDLGLEKAKILLSSLNFLRLLAPLPKL